MALDKLLKKLFEFWHLVFLFDFQLNEGMSLWSKVAKRLGWLHRLYSLLAKEREKVLEEALFNMKAWPGLLVARGDENNGLSLHRGTCQSRPRSLQGRVKS